MTARLLVGSMQLGLVPGDRLAVLDVHSADPDAPVWVYVPGRGLKRLRRVACELLVPAEEERQS